MSLTDYFDLSKTATLKLPVLSAPQPVSVGGGAAAAPALAPAPPPPAQAPLSMKWQVTVYSILLVSILSSRFLDLYRAGALAQWKVDWPYLVFMAIASMLAFPAVYDRAKVSSGQPVLVQVALIFATGMGWEKLVATAVGK